MKIRIIKGIIFELEEAKRLMKVGEVLTVETTEVSNFHTDVIFQEHPNKKFNSVMFALNDESGNE